MSMRRFHALAQRRRQRPTWRCVRPTLRAMSSLRSPSKARMMIVARWRSREGAVTAREKLRRISCCRSVMVVLAALPGMVKQLLVTGKIVNPGNSGATVNFLGFQLRKAGLVGPAGCYGSWAMPKLRRASLFLVPLALLAIVLFKAY